MRDELELLKDDNNENLSDEELAFCKDIEILLGQVGTFTPPKEVDNRILLAASLRHKKKQSLLKWMPVAACVALALVIISIVSIPTNNVEQSAEYKNFIHKVKTQPKVLVENKRLNESLENLDDRLLEFEEELFLLALEESFEEFIN